MPAPTQEPPIPLERYASLHAEIEASAELDTVLEREQVTPETWLAAQAYWLKRMADEAHRKRFETTTRYQAVFTAKRKVFEARFARDRRKAERVPPAPPAVGLLAGLGAELDAPLRVAPAFDVSDPPAARESKPQHAPLLPPAAVPIGVFTPAPPPEQTFRSPAIAPPERVVAPVESGSDLEPRSRRSATMMIEPQGPATAPTPFVPAGSAGAAATPFQAEASAAVTQASRAGQTEVPPPPPKGDLNSTWNVLEEAAVARAATPFNRGAGSAPGVVVPPALATVNETAPLDMSSEMRRQLREALPLPNKHQPGTGGIDEQALRAARASATPFAGGAPGQIPAALPPAFRARPPLAPLDDDDDDAPRTKLVDGDALAAAIAKVTPFDQRRKPPSSPPPPDEDNPRTVAFDVPAPTRESLPFGSAATVPNPAARFPPLAPIATPGAAPVAASASAKPRRFSINVFASLTAEIAENPGEAEAIRTRYGLSESDHHEESQRWTEEFQKSDDTRQRYLGIVQRYRGYIQQRKNG